MPGDTASTPDQPGAGVLVPEAPAALKESEGNTEPVATPPEPLISRSPDPTFWTVKKLDLSSMLRFASAFSLFLALVTVVAVAVLFVSGAATGVNRSTENLIQGFWGPDFRLEAAGVLRWTAVLALTSAALLTLLIMIGSLVYNLVCDLTGGIRVMVAGDRTKMDREGP